MSDWYLEIPDRVVYYIAKGDRIKIGTTGSLAARMRVLEPDELLATEPGWKEQEAHRHRQFQHLRLDGEWFADVPELRAHIALLDCELVKDPGGRDQQRQWVQQRQQQRGCQARGGQAALRTWLTESLARLEKGRRP